MLLSSLGTSSANVALPALAMAFDASFQAVQWVVLAYLLGITTTVVSAGRLGDLLGRRRLLLAGLSLFTAASVLCGLAPALWLLVMARAAQGVGAAVMLALAMALIGAALPREKTGTAMGLLGTMSALGTALGPTLGGFLLAGWGWQAIFLLNLPLGLLAVLLAWRNLPADPSRVSGPRAHSDHPGTIMLVATLAAYALAMTPAHGAFGTSNLALLAAAVIGAGLFVHHESRAAAPLVRLAILRDPVLGCGFASSALVTTVVMSTLVVGPFHLAGALALDPLRVGLAMSVGPIVAAAAGVPAGRLVDRIGASRAGVGGLLAMQLGAVVVAALPIHFGVPGYVGPLAVITAGYALFQAANNTAVMTGIADDQRGVVSGLLNLSRNLGLITGASLMGAVFALGTGSSDVATASVQAIAGGTRLTFAVAALLLAGALGLAVAQHRRSHRDR
jgi:MFS family permease